nr:hypothetical protein [Nocardioides aquaticus]
MSQRPVVLGQHPRASRQNSAPSRVGTTERVVRSKSRTPIRRSTSCTVRLSEDWAVCSRAAAAEYPDSSATATTARR